MDIYCESVGQCMNNRKNFRNCIRLVNDMDIYCKCVGQCINNRTNLRNCVRLVKWISTASVLDNV